MPINDSPPQVCFLLALWGKNYIRMFCEISLRSMLARGNIPAVAEEYNCTFTLLTTVDDIAFFEAQPLIPLLRQYCKIRYVDIQDIIFPNNHSATLTVALERGMKSFGPEMLNTYFIFLVADYLFAGNSFAGLLPYMRQGASAISAGNYQIVEEEVLGCVRNFIDPATGIIDVSHRKLMAWSLKHLHPMTVANTVNQPNTHTKHTNRLFWRVDENTLIGRFYLRHMLCLKPEIQDYVIGASCDYSFIAEMCPSGNVVHLNDSDEYFVVELQPLLHEGKYLATGPHDPDALAKSLELWTTDEQRANAHSAVIFHCAELPACTESVLKESEGYISQMEILMQVPPSALRGHFYWRSCIQWISANRACEPESLIEQADSLYHNLWASPVFGPPLAEHNLSMDMFPPMRDQDVSDNTRKLLWYFKLYTAWSGKLPHARLWHPHFLDYRLLKHALKSGENHSILLILKPSRRQWIEWSVNPDFMLRTPLIAYCNADSLRTQLKTVTSCIIHLPAEYDACSGAIFDRLMEAMQPGSLIHIFLKSPLFSSQCYSAAHRALRYSHLSQKPGIKLISHTVYTGRIRRYMDKWLSLTATSLINHRPQPLTVLLCGLQVALLHAVYIFHNILVMLLPPRSPAKDASVCSALLTFRIES